MKILLIEPFYSGSHKHFADQLQKYSSHEITLLTMDGRFWKWRMYGAAVTMAERFIDESYRPDLILTTDMLDVSTFLSMVRHHLPSHVPVVTYFHENQFAYPWQEDSEDIQQKRDLHYGMLNYQSAVVSDFVLFNSKYNMNSFFEGVTSTLSKMPDYKHTEAIRKLKDKSQVMPLGLELAKLSPNPYKTNINRSYDHAPLILWNHRWEHDKNPMTFFEGLKKLQDKQLPFRLALVGESYKSMPKEFKDAKDRFKNELIHYGYASRERYIELLNEADVLPVTSNHDFFGMSVMEAIHCGALPLLPKRLTYPDLYDANKHPNIFYATNKDFIDQLEQIVRCLLDHQSTLKNSKSTLESTRMYLRELTYQYDWSKVIKSYDRFFKDTGTTH